MEQKNGCTVREYEEVGGGRMKEYIERTVAKVKILSWAVCIDNPKLLSKEDTMYCIDNIPAANVAEVRYGRWIPEICESISKRNRLIEYKVYSCSLCGRSNGRVKKKYCPNCGALMKEDEHETVQ